ncbi:MAG: T9SS type A sorting domain-containing protein [Bacteroidetes bacterium]|nr:T9SS type A sorting domain-containing protein [Bacteroidota bacterium]
MKKLLLSSIFVLLTAVAMLSGVEAFAQNSRLWGTYYGGTNNDEGFAVARDLAGNVYLAGYTADTTASIFASSGAFQGVYGGGTDDAFLVKFDAAGNRLWSTYYGGSGTDYGYALSTDVNGNVYLAGYTNSPAGIAAGGFQNTIGGGYDAFLVKFDANGNRLWSTYFGGTANESSGASTGEGLATDAGGNVILTGVTASPNGIASGGFQNTYGGANDAFVAKFNAGGNLLWSTYYGGTSAEQPYDASADMAGNIYVAGATQSTTNISSPGAFQTGYGGGTDAFVVKFGPGGNRIWGTYYGGGSADEGRALKVNGRKVYLSGRTQSTSGIASPGAFQTVQGGGGNYDAYLVKFDSSGTRNWGTYYGNTGSDAGYGLAIDSRENIYQAGRTSSATGIATPGAFQTTFSGTIDNMLVKWDSAGIRLCATYAGTTGSSLSFGAAIGGGKVYIGGYTSSTGGIAGNGYQNTFGGGGFGANDGFLIKFESCISDTIVSVSAKCNGQCNGTATAQGKWATLLPYSYVWSTIPAQNTQTATGLCAGKYYVTVTDANGNANTDSVTITQPATIAITMTSLPASSCSPCNGAANASVSGGTSPYMYAWSPGGGNAATATGLCSGNYTVNVTDANGCTGTATVTVGGTSAGPTASISSSTNLKCNGQCIGTATAAGTGGTPPYTYAWSNGQSTQTATGLCAANYTATVADANGCFSTATVTITQPPVLSSGGSVKNVTCNGACDGSATITVAGGTPPYTYSWAPGGQTTSTATGLCAGNYTATVTDANGCTVSMNYPIVQPSSIGIATSSNNATSCAPCNGSASAAVVGGTPPYMYAWAPSGGNSSAATGLCPGNYTLTVTDANACTATATVSVGGTAGVITSISSSINIVCKGSCTGSATASGSGGTLPYTYAWSDGQTDQTATGLCAGSYTVTITDAGGCYSSASVNITEPATALTAATSQVNVTCNGMCNGMASVNASGGTPPYTYMWSPNSQTTPGISNQCAGNYTATVTDALGCVLTETFSITQPSSLGIGTTSNNATSCAPCDGSASAVVVGGTPPYTYAWSPVGGNSSAATGLCAGSFTVNVTDANGCTNSSIVSITGPVPPSATISSSTNATCNAACDGSATVSVLGGTPPFTYLWTPGGQTTSTATGLCAGSHNVTVTDAGGCSSSANVVITQPAALTGFRSHTDVTCNGLCNGTATVNVSGGTPPYAYTWVPTGGNASTATGLCAGNYTVNITDANNCTLARTYTVTQPSSIGNAMSSNSSSSCSPCNGTASATTIGGTPPYTYAWLPTGGNSSAAAGLCAGNYTVEITDANGCTGSATVSVGGLSGPIASVSSTNVTCNSACDGTASATGSGGTPPYTFAWAPGGETTSAVTGLCAGSYTVTISDAGGCFSSSVVNITQPSALNGSPTQTNVSCNSACTGQAGITVSGGNSPYTYMWNNGATTASATGLCAGNYTVTITDASGCTLTHTYTITQPSSIGIATTSNNSTSCTPCDGSASASAVGGVLPYNYMWSPSGGNAASATGLCAGIYTVTVTDGNSCMATSTVSIGGPMGPTVTITSSGPSATATATGNSPFTYSWSDGQTTSTATGLSTGTYTVCVTDNGGCITCATVTISLTGVGVPVATNSVKIYPNPTTEIVFVEGYFSNPQTITISVMNMLGKTMFREQVNSGNYMNKKLYTGNLAQGIYFLQIVGNGAILKTEKLVIQ